MSHFAPDHGQRRNFVASSLPAPKPMEWGFPYALLRRRPRLLSRLRTKRRLFSGVRRVFPEHCYSLIRHTPSEMDIAERKRAVYARMWRSDRHFDRLMRLVERREIYLRRREGAQADRLYMRDMRRWWYYNTSCGGPRRPGVRRSTRTSARAGPGGDDPGGDARDHEREVVPHRGPRP
jgi:hypothetical protein